ncbi:hypothetical protein GH714_003455 [Hevea brasiliensis]|uniref:DUF4219 domain-containing protein n=1 Tax=Hevea brasiliensis TaxID=3981 RepID=A0A6A6M004_HEVBR|nr:hypothetical protein GH714_003455 [Hevea brasiliensis]
MFKDERQTRMGPHSGPQTGRLAIGSPINPRETQEGKKMMKNLVKQSLHKNMEMITRRANASGESSKLNPWLSAQVLRACLIKDCIHSRAIFKLSFRNEFFSAMACMWAAIPRFDDHYDHWSMLMENFLRSKEYWQIVSVGIPESADGATLTDVQKTEIEGLKLKDFKAKNYLFHAIDRSILETIICKDTSKQIWDSMKKKYAGSAE